MTHVSLFTGIGGLDLAAEAAGIETVLQVEREPYALQILERHWPNVPRITDVREVHNDERWTKPTVVSGGFPCQPFSAAGKRRGADDDRYLWPELLRIVEELQPSWVVGENVSGLLSIRDGMEIDDMLASLEAQNYTPWILHYPATGVGAHHKRDRVFIVAHREDSGADRRQRVKMDDAANGGEWADRAIGSGADGRGQNVGHTPQQLRDGSGRTRRRRHEHSDGGQDVADAESIGRRGGRPESAGQQGELCASWGGSPSTVTTPHPQSNTRRECDGDGGAATGVGTTESRLGRVADGFPSELDGGGLNEERSDKKTKPKTREFEWEAMRALWKYRESTAPPSELRIGGLYNLVPNVPREIARRAWYMGKRSEKDKVLRDMWERVHSASQQEAQDLLERMSERIRSSKRNEAMGWCGEPAGIPRVATGVKDRAARLKALGNAVVPAQAFPIFYAIAQTEAQNA